MDSRQNVAGLSVEQSGEVLIARFPSGVRLTGQLADAVGERLATVLEGTGNRLLFDFENVRLITSNMLGRLVELNRMADQSGGRIALCNLKPDIAKIFEITKLQQVLAIYDSESEALSSLD